MLQNSNRIDLLSLLLLSLVSFCFSLFLSDTFPELIYKVWNLWFSSGTPRVFSNIRPDVNSVMRVHTHPLFSVIIKPVALLFSLVGIGTLNFCRFLLAFSGAVTTGALFSILRSCRLSTFSSFLGSAVFICSGAFVFWWSVLETFPIGAAVITLVFFFISANLKSKALWVLATPLTFGLTVTNWVVCIIGVFQLFNRKKSIYILASGILLSAFLFILQTQYLISPTFELVDKVVKEQRFLIYPKNVENIPMFAEIYIKRALVFCSSPAVVAQGRLEDVQVSDHEGVAYGFFDYSRIGWLAVVCWFSLLLRGASNLFKSVENPRLARTLFCFLSFEFILHLFYGDSPFLYCAHYATGLVIVASCSLEGRHSRVFQVIALVFCICALWSNLETFHDSIDMFIEANKD